MKPGSGKGVPKELLIGFGAIAVYLAILLVGFICFYNFYVELIAMWPVALSFVIPSIALVISLIIIIKKRRSYDTRQWLLRIVMIVILLECAGQMFKGPMVLRVSDLALKTRVSRSISLDEIQSRAAQVLSQFNEDLAHDRAKEPFSLYTQNKFPELDNLNATIRRPMFGDENESCLVFSWGGGFFSWGFCVGSPKFKLDEDVAENYRWWTSKWKDGIYGWQE